MGCHVPPGLCALLKAFLKDTDSFAIVARGALKLGPRAVQVRARVSYVLVFERLEQVAALVFTLEPATRFKAVHATVSHIYMSSLRTQRHDGCTHVP